MLPGEELAGLRGYDDGANQNNFENAIERQKGITVNTWPEGLTSLDIVMKRCGFNEVLSTRRLPRQRPSGSFGPSRQTKKDIGACSLCKKWTFDFSAHLATNRNYSTMYATRNMGNTGTRRSQF